MKPDGDRAGARHDALARFLGSGRPADLHAALRADGPVILAHPGVQTKLTEWYVILLLEPRAIALWGRYPKDSPKHVLAQTARDGLRGIGRALLPPRPPGRPK